MKNIIILAGLFFISINGLYAKTPAPTDSINIINKTIASKLLNDGIYLYQEGKNLEALLKFREAAEKDPTNWRAIYYISMISYDKKNFHQALSQIKTALKIDKADQEGELLEQYARSLHRIGNVDEALVNYKKAQEKLSKALSKELQVSLHIQQCQFAKKEMNSGRKTKRKVISRRVNSKYHEYSPVLADSGKVLYFTSRRADTKGKSLNPADQQYFEDIYIAKWNPEIKDWDSITNKIKRFNTPGFDALSYVSPDGAKALITINTEACVKVTTRGSDIFETKKSKRSGKFGTPKILKNKTINTTFFEGAATLTKNGKTMYFVTDRNFEKKATDIWVVHKEGNSWGKAKALSDVINTPGRETTPFISEDGKYLFFSSNGHVGMGGLDIYVSENKKGEWTKPINLGIMVNSVNNDTHFQYYPALKKAMMASIVSKKGKNNIDIYEVDMEGFVMPKK